MWISTHGKRNTCDYIHVTLVACLVRFVHDKSKSVDDANVMITSRLIVFAVIT